MARIAIIIFGVVAVQLVHCAPSNDKESIDLSKVESKLDVEPSSVFENDELNVNNKESQRHKRWYNNVPYNYQPPFIRQYDTRSEIENSLSYIQMRLQEILTLTKSPSRPPPAPSVYPVYVPVYISQPSCCCNPADNEQPTTKAPVLTPTTKAPVLTPTTKAPILTPTSTPSPQNETIPSLHDRLPEMEDERQNWGIVVNNTLADYDDDDDGSRPISLTPTLTGNDGGRPAPPVDHGSSQADINNEENQRATTASPSKFERPGQSLLQPSVCDRAAMSCCFGLDPTFKCIQSRGCRDRNLGVNPCNQQYLLGVITRLQNFYGQS